jgi:hypothetical protein
MKAKVARMSPLRKLLEAHGVHTIRRLRELTGLTSQQCWNLWHGRVGVGRKTALRLHEQCGIPLDDLMRLPPVPHAARFGRRHKPQPPAEEGPTHE